MKGEGKGVRVIYVSERFRWQLMYVLFENIS
jgi:hypothetical protein